MELLELQDDDKDVMKLRSEELPEGWKDIKQVLHYQGLLYVPKVIRLGLISRHHNDLLAGHFGIEKTRELITRKYYWPMIQRDVEAYVKGCDVCLASKAVCNKPYGDLQSLPIWTHWWKDLSINFVTGLPISANWKGDSYGSILVIIDRLTKMVHYELVKVTNNAPGLAEVIINMIMRHHVVPQSIVTDRGSLFTSKFSSSLCYFLGIKQKLFTALYSQMNGQTERQISIMEVYLRAFVNWEQDNWVRLLLMAEFAYNNPKNASTGHTFLVLHSGYHPRVSFEEDVDPHSRSCSANELAEKLRELMEACYQNLFYWQKLQKRAYNKGVKSLSYALGEKVWLNSKYIKTKMNKNLANKFFRPFQVLHAVRKHAYKLKLSTKWKILDVFHVSLLEWDTMRKGQVL